jgi:ribosomal protein S18 acetylase RimI-like enzyme
MSSTIADDNDQFHMSTFQPNTFTQAQHDIVQSLVQTANNVDFVIALQDMIHYVMTVENEASSDMNEFHVIGLVSFLVGQESLHNICIDAQYRRRGLATKLLQHALQDIWKRDISILTLQVHRDNVGAQTVYTRLGFQHLDDYVPLQRDGQEISTDMLQFVMCDCDSKSIDDDDHLAPIPVTPEQVIDYLQPTFPNIKIEFDRFMGHAEYYYDDFTVYIDGESRYFEVDWELLRKHPPSSDLIKRTSDEVIAILQPHYPNATLKFQHFMVYGGDACYDDCFVDIDGKCNLFAFDWSKHTVTVGDSNPNTSPLYNKYNFKTNTFSSNDSHDSPLQQE